MNAQVEEHPELFESDFRNLDNFVSEAKEKRSRQQELDDYELNFYEEALRLDKEY